MAIDFINNKFETNLFDKRDAFPFSKFHIYYASTGSDI